MLFEITFEHDKRMSYALSQLDKDNFNWFRNDKTRNLLAGIKVVNGSIRGIYPCHIEFSYRTKQSKQ